MVMFMRRKTGEERKRMLERIADRLASIANPEISWSNRPNKEAWRLLADALTTNIELEYSMYDTALEPDHTRPGIFADHNCAGCSSGKSLCVEGNPLNCSWPVARNH
jgi:hypothetical protein